MKSLMRSTEMIISASIHIYEKYRLAKNKVALLSLLKQQKSLLKAFWFIFIHTKKFSEPQQCLII